MNLYDRYMAGEYQQVWQELQDLGPDVRLAPYATEAQAVAKETMRRVSRNVNLVASRLQSMNYKFDRFPDGTRRHYQGAPVARPDNLREDCAELDEQAGPLPLSLLMFWEEVGAVDFVGGAQHWPEGLDPLVVDPPEGALSFLCELDEDEQAAENAEWFAALAPDDLHKDNTSGGDPYGLFLPDAAADFRFLNERHELLFVPYLRLAILECGGFPGIRVHSISLPALPTLIAGLEPF